MNSPSVRAQIENFAHQIAEKFRPEKIILFGSHAYGTATHDSDVDLLVIMLLDGKSPHEQAVEIRKAIIRSFPLDLLVRSPTEVEERMAMNDWFIHEIVQQGITLYAARDA